MAVSWTKSPVPGFGVRTLVFVVRQSGFSLIEALIAVLLLAFVLLGIAYHELGTTESVAQARRITEATNLAQMQLERLANKDASDDFPDGTMLSPNGQIGGIYKLNWTVGSPVGGIREVIVKVTWADKDDQGSHNDSVQLQTLFWSQ